MQIIHIPIPSRNVVSSYVKLGAVGVVDKCWRWVQMRSEMRRLRMRMASCLVLPRACRRW